MIDTDKYEGHDALLIADAPLLLEEVKRLQYWDEEMDRVIAHLTKHDWDSSDGDVQDIVEYILNENKRLCGIAKTCLEAIEAGGDMRTATVELIEHNLKLMVVNE